MDAVTEAPTAIKKLRERVEKKMRGTPVSDRKPAAKGKRTERLDMRLTKAEKQRVAAKAKKLRRTITSVVLEAVEKIK